VLAGRGAFLRGGRGFFAFAFALGLVCGLAIWNSSLAIPAFTGMAVGLLLAGERPGRGTLVFAAGVAIGVVPLLIARLTRAAPDSCAPPARRRPRPRARCPPAPRCG